MIGVWMEDESTVITVSHGIRRPNGANTALNFLTGGSPAELSGKRLMGVSDGTWFAGTTGKGVGKVEDDDREVVGSALGTGG